MNNILSSDPSVLLEGYSGMLTVAIVVSIFFVFVMAIGVWATRRTKNASDFFAAGKQIGTLALALAAFSSTMSGFLFVGAPGLIYSIGTGALWFTVSTSLAFTVLWVVVGKRMRLLVEVREILTVPDAIDVRFKSKAATLLASISILVGVVLYLATQLLAMGIVIGYVFNISNAAGVIIGMIITLAYAVGGGMLAGVYTDVFQGLVMAVASLFILVMAVLAGGGLENITTTIATSPLLADGALGSKFVSPFGVMPFTLVMSWFLLFALGVIGQPHLVHKFFMIKDIKKLKMGALMSTIPSIISGLLAFTVGLSVKSLVLSGQLEPLLKADDTIIVFLLHYTTPVLTGIAFAGIASAIMSTADSFINIAAASAVRDIPKAMGVKISEKQELSYGRIVSILCGVISVVLALTLSSGGIAILGAFGWGTFAAALAPVIGLGFNWSGATKQGAVISITSGLILAIGLELGKVLAMPWYVTYIAPLGIYNGVLAFCISLILLIVTSYVTSKDEMDKDIQSVMEY